MPEISQLDQYDSQRSISRRIDHNGAGVGEDSKGPVDIGSRLHKIRKARHLTLQDASALTGVSASAFSKIERNELSPTISTMQRIAEGLDVELVTLISEQNDEPAGFGGRRSITRAGAGSAHTTATCNNVLLCADLKNKQDLKEFEDSAILYKNTVWHFVRVED